MFVCTYVCTYAMYTYMHLDCLRVIEKKQDLVKPSSAQEEQVADEVTPNVNTDAVPTKTGSYIVSCMYVST